MTSPSVPKKSYLFSRYCLGFTLMESLVILAILSCLLVCSVPSARGLFRESRTITEVNSLVSGLYYARSAAIQLGEKVDFCESANHKSCNGRWNEGQVILEPNGHVLRSLPALAKNDMLVWNSSGGQDNKVEWLPTGYTNGQRGSFYYCSEDVVSSYSRTIVLLNTGRIYVSTMTPEDYDKYCPHP